MESTRNMESMGCSNSCAARARTRTSTGSLLIFPLVMFSLCLHSSAGAACEVGGKCAAADSILLQAKVRQARSSAEKPPGETFDIVVVGAGLTGSATAARLAEKLPGKRMLVIEGGKSDKAVRPGSWDWGSQKYKSWPGNWWRNLSIVDVPGAYGGMHCWSAGCTEMSWPGEYTAGQYQAKVEGGGGSINGALHQKPTADMFRGDLSPNWPAWPKGWDMSVLDPYFDEVKEAMHLTQTPSADGVHYLDASGGSQLEEVLASSCSACDEERGLIDHADMELPLAGGMGVPVVAAENGVRKSTASTFLAKALRTHNIQMWLETEVTEVLHHDSVARSLKVLRDGTEQFVHLARDGLLVMAAGPFNTPRLLLKSGIDNAGMGKNLSDHLITSQEYSVPTKFNMQPFAVSENDIGQEVVFEKGPLSQFGPLLLGFFRDPTTPGAAHNWDVELFISPQADASKLTVYLSLMRPQCSWANLSLDANGHLVMSDRASLYLGCEEDVKAMQYAMDFVRQRMEAHGASCDKNARMEDAPRYAMNHWVGSCALGSCVDPDTLLVYGTRNVAVVDASIIPRQVWAHPAWTEEAMALRAGDLLAEAAGVWHR